MASNTVRVTFAAGAWNVIFREFFIFHRENMTSCTKVEEESNDTTQVFDCTFEGEFTILQYSIDDRVCKMRMITDQDLVGKYKEVPMQFDNSDEGSALVIGIRLGNMGEDDVKRVFNGVTATGPEETAEETADEPTTEG